MPLNVPLTELSAQARSFLAGNALTFEQANALWTELLKRNEVSQARTVLERLRDDGTLLDRLPPSRETRRKLCRKEAMLTSKDPELSAAVRHDRAIEVLAEEFDLDDAALDGDGETLGIAAGIYKRKWYELGQLADLKRAAALYERGALGPLGPDAYAQINAAFLDDLLAHTGDDPGVRRGRAKTLRERIINELPEKADDWWNTATRVEALFGLGRYAEAKTVLEAAKAAMKEGNRPAPWELEATARQLATLAHLRETQPLRVPGIREFFAALLPGAADAVRSAFVGKVGLALSGGGFRASFYHLGVLARLAELNVLRHIDVLSCVSGGSIVGACYWLALRRRFLDTRPIQHADYIELVRELIHHFEKAVALDLRGGVQGSRIAAAYRVLMKGERGILDPEAVAAALERDFYRPLLPGVGTLYMHDLPFTPKDHDPAITGSAEFHPTRDNWLRAHKVPALVINATTVNTGHAWQFTSTWMGESPWAVHEAADNVPRLQWSWYEPKAGWQMALGRAVAASACVPGVFQPLSLEAAYADDLQVRLLDGGVYDNQGTVALLAANCNVVLVSDAAGQLLLERQPAPGLKGLGSYAMRAMDTLMERVRQVNFGDLSARRMTGLVRGLMFLHMKAGLDANPIRLRFSTEAHEIRRSTLTASGVRKDFQQALAELRTDLDAFSLDESRALMACGYQMASKAFQRDVGPLAELWDSPVQADWPFDELLREITSTAAATPRRDELLTALRAGNKVQV
jgi:predicted acylesterase/phospholipase RssA